MAITQRHFIYQIRGGSTMNIVFLGGARYSRPLDQTNERKFRLLAELGEMFVIGFSNNLRPRRFREHACFYLFLKWPLPILHYL